VKLYLDEDISPIVPELLRKKGVKAVSAHERAMTGVTDEEQLLAAVNERRVMVTRNRNDFIALTIRFFQDLKPHSGLIIVPHSIPGSDFNLLAKRLLSCVKKHPKGLEPYTIEFVSRVV
jgi:predicted nuclease of predicted toxin-antitoxin system